MNIQPKQITLTPSKIVTLTSIDVVETHELKKSKYLRARLKQGVFVEFRGAEWEALGQWTDESLDTAIAAKLGLVEV